MSRVSSLEHDLTQKCFEANRLASYAYLDGDMETYHRLRGAYEAYKDAAQITEMYFEKKEGEQQ